jgi:hypothetical protein
MRKICSKNNNLHRDTKSVIHEKLKHRVFYTLIIT